MASDSELDSNVRYCYRCGQSYPQPHPESCEKCGSHQFAKKYGAIEAGGCWTGHFISIVAILFPIIGIIVGLIQVTNKDTRVHGFILIGISLIFGTLLGLAGGRIIR